MLDKYAIIAYKYKVYINRSKLYKYGNIHYIKTAIYINTIKTDVILYKHYETKRKYEYI